MVQAGFMSEDEKATYTHPCDGILGLTLLFLCQNHLQIAKKYARKLVKIHWKDF